MPRRGLHCPALPYRGIALLRTAFHFPEYNHVVLFLVFVAVTPKESPKTIVTLSKGDRIG